MTLSVNISIPASHAGGDQVSLADVEQLLISIPASHAGGDQDEVSTIDAAFDFNPRLPCGRRPLELFLQIVSCVFQSPPPMREATRLRWSRWPICRHFNPRLPCGRRLPFLHCPVEDLAFQSPPPMREATALHPTDARALIISIPASRMGGDEDESPSGVRFKISIPASHAGGDQDYREYHIARDISIPASHAGGDVS